MIKFTKLILIVLTLALVISCNGNNDVPKIEDYKHNLLCASLGYIESLGFGAESVLEQKIINFKNGDRYFFIKVSTGNSINFAISVQFEGTYNKIIRDFENVVVTSCNNEGACKDCNLSLQGNCGIMGCGCNDQSSMGAYDCNLKFTDINKFTSVYYKKGSAIANEIDITNLIELNCESF